VHLTLLDHAIARLVLSVCLSIRLCVCHIPVFVQMNEDTIILVSGEVKFIRIYAGDHP